jgi:hypothetical protein
MVSSLHQKISLILTNGSKYLNMIALENKNGFNTETGEKKS